MLTTLLAIAIQLQEPPYPWTGEFPPPPGPVCGVLDSPVEPDFRFHEGELTRAYYDWAVYQLRVTVPQWIEQGMARGESEVGWEASMLHGNAMTLVELYVDYLEVQAAPPEEHAEAVTRFCDQLAHSVRID